MPIGTSDDSRLGSKSPIKVRLTNTTSSQTHDCESTSPSRIYASLRPGNNSSCGTIYDEQESDYRIRLIVLREALRMCALEHRRA